MRLLAKVWKCLIHQDFSTWSPNHGALYRQLLGRRKIIGFEWETKLPVPRQLFRNLPQDHIIWGVGKDCDYQEIRIAFHTTNPKAFANSFFGAYRTMYANGVLPTGYHLSLNLFPRVSKGSTMYFRNKDLHKDLHKGRHYAKYHDKLFGYSTDFRVQPAKSLIIGSNPLLFQFKPLMAALTPYQVLMEVVLRNYMLNGMISNRLYERKIEDTAAVLLSTVPSHLLQLFNYSPRCIMYALVEAEKKRHTLA